MKRKRYRRRYLPRYVKYAPSLITPDQYSNRTLRALLVKLSRDYLGFFKNLSELYGASKQKKEVDAVTVEIKKTIAIVESVLSSGTMSKGDVETLVEQTEKINAARDYFLEQVNEVGAFRERVEKVTRETGVSLQDLNITEQVVRRGAGQIRRAEREGAVPFLRRTMPGVTKGVGVAARGVGVAALGPFAPLAGMAGTALRDVAGLTRGIAEKVRRRKERALESQLRPMAMGAPPATFERLLGARERGRPLTGFGGVSQRRAVARPTKEQMVLPLTYFFDKKAHKARWTREVLNRFKALEKRLRGKGLAGMLGLGGLAKRFGMLGAGLLPLIGKAGLFAALAVGVGLSLVQFKKLGGAISDWLKARVGKKEAKKREAYAAGTWEKELLTRKDPIAALKEAVKTGKISPQIGRRLRERMTPGYVEMHKKAVQYTAETEEAKALTERITGGMETREELLKAVPSRIRSPFAGGVPAGTSVAEMKELQKSIDGLSDSIKRDKAPEDIRRAGLGNIYDSGDALGNEFASGGVTIGN